MRVRNLHALGVFERFHESESRNGVGHRARDDPGEQRAPRLVLRGRVRETQKVAVRKGVTVLVLDDLERQFGDRLIEIPSCHAVAQSAAPAAELLHVRRKLEKVRTRAANRVESAAERETARVLVAKARTHGECEDCRRDLGCATRERDRDDAFHDARAV